MKKLIPLILTAAMTLTLTACPRCRRFLHPEKLQRLF